MRWLRDKKFSSQKSIPLIHRIPLHSVSQIRTTLNTMKNRLAIFKALLFLCCIAVTTTVFGQDFYIWTNQAPTFPGGGYLGIGANWTNVSAGANGLANPANTD